MGKEDAPDSRDSEVDFHIKIIVESKFNAHTSKTFFSGPPGDFRALDCDGCFDLIRNRAAPNRTPFLWKIAAIQRVEPTGPGLTAPQHVNALKNLKKTDGGNLFSMVVRARWFPDISLRRDTCGTSV